MSNLSPHSYSDTSKPALRVAIGSLGAVGRALATRLIGGGIDGLELRAVSARDQARARAWLTQLSESTGSEAAAKISVMELDELAQHADIVVEAAPAAVFAQIAQPAVNAGRLFVPISVGALLEHSELAERARETGARIVVPTGALLGLDAVRAAAEGRNPKRSYGDAQTSKRLGGCTLFAARRYRLRANHPSN